MCGLAQEICKGARGSKRGLGLGFKVVGLKVVGSRVWGLPRAICPQKSDPNSEGEKAGKGKSETECCEKAEQIDLRRRRSICLR